MGRVLIIDDNRDLAETTAALVRALGYEVTTLYDGLAALLEVERRLPDVIVLDIGLPHIDGIHVARRIREQYGNTMRLIACTGYGDEGTRQKMLRAGFDAIFIKPVSTAHLLDAIATAPVRRPDTGDRRGRPRGESDI